MDGSGTQNLRLNDGAREENRINLFRETKLPWFLCFSLTPLNTVPNFWSFREDDFECIILVIDIDDWFIRYC
jgi:hypothetical protein